jgi:hypothetical protein
MAGSLQCIVLKGAGLECHVSRLGATIVKFLAPDRSGQLAGVRAGAQKRVALDWTSQPRARLSLYTLASLLRVRVRRRDVGLRHC